MLRCMKKRDGRKLDKSELNSLRNLVAKTHRQTGGNAAETARRLRVSRYFVIKWRNRYIEEYDRAIKEGRSKKNISLESKKRGRRAKNAIETISKQIISDAEDLIIENTPKEVGINSLLWTERAVKKLFKHKFELKINPDAVYEFIQWVVFYGAKKQYLQNYRELKNRCSSYNGWGLAIVNGYIYFLKKPYHMKNKEWRPEIYKLVLKQRKKKALWDD